MVLFVPRHGSGRGIWSTRDSVSSGIWRRPRPSLNKPRRGRAPGIGGDRWPAQLPRAIAEVLGLEVEHEPVSCTANRIEQDHRGIKHRYYPTLGFHNFDAAQRFCRVVEEVRNFLRPRRWMGEKVSLAERRGHFLQRVEELHSLFAPA